MRRQSPGHDHRRGENQAGQQQVRGQPVLADIGAVYQAGCHHPPADGALQAAEQQQPDKLRFQGALQPAARPEQQQRQREHGADPARQDTMRPFPPEDRLEVAERHVVVELLVFGNLLVLREFLLPFGIRQRRDDAVDRLPFGDRQAGIGEPRGAADQEQRKHHQQHEIEPAAHHRAVAALAVARSERRVELGDGGHEASFRSSLIW